MDKKLEIIAHRGHWAGMEGLQNTETAINNAIRVGFSVELDLRIGETSGGEILVTHDKEKHGELLEDILNKVGSMPKTYFHIKNKSLEMLLELKYLLSNIKEPFDFKIFGIPKSHKSKYAKVFGWDKIMYELETGVKGNWDEAINSKSECIWFGNRKGIDIDKYEELLNSNKKVYLVAPELFGMKFDSQDLLRAGGFEGVCTDLPIYYKHKYAITKRTGKPTSSGVG